MSADTRRMFRFLAIVAAMGALSVLLVGCDGQINLFGSPTQIQGQPSASPTPSPTPSPSSSPSATPESCRIDYMILRPTDGLTLANNAEATLDLTPYQTVTNPDGSVAQKEVSRACNDPRIASVVWSSSSASVVFASGGFNPTIRRVGVGVATVTANLENHPSNSISVRTP